ncbi:ANL family adenylate-forming protein [Flagellimonas sp. S174]|uniref:ANL family adenylate-forming protein n=1 Tax=Flagellimonas sp. S174 TaxID=3410790 RepID=UPI003BF55666
MILDTIKAYEGKAIIEKKGAYTYEDLNNQIEYYVEQLKTAILRNEVVIVSEDYSFSSIAVILALSKYPCIIVPLVFTTEDEFTLKKEACNANKILRIRDDEIFIEKIQKVDNSKNSDYSVITSEGESGIVLFSSGTTGKPKVMVHNFNNLINSFKAPRRQKTLVFLLFLMFDHIGGLNTLLGCLNTGTTMVLPENRNPLTIASLIEEHKVQVLPASPTFLNLMLMTEGIRDKDLSSLKMVTYGTERMPEALLNKLNERMPFVRFLQTFGTSESGIIKTKSKNSNSLFFKITDVNVEHKVVNGELYLKTKTSIKGYRNLKSKSFLDDGWFATGDLVDVDEEGYIKIIGRINDVINVGGLKVFPSEVEKKINEVEGVLDSTVYAKKNAITGEMVCAKVLIDGKSEPLEVKKRIKVNCDKNLEKYKRPVKLILLNEFKYTSRFKKTM